MPWHDPMISFDNECRYTPWRGLMKSLKNDYITKKNIDL